MIILFQKVLKKKNLGRQFANYTLNNTSIVPNTKPEKKYT